MISRLHARLFYHHGHSAVELEDHSTRGTFVDGVRVAKNTRIAPR